jgi:hypothetical protein
LINSWLIRLWVDNVFLINTRSLSIVIDKPIPLSIGCPKAKDRECSVSHVLLRFGGGFLEPVLWKCTSTDFVGDGVSDGLVQTFREWSSGHLIPQWWTTWPGICTHTVTDPCALSSKTPPHEKPVLRHDKSELRVDFLSFVLTELGKILREQLVFLVPLSVTWYQTPQSTTVRGEKKT